MSAIDGWFASPENEARAAEQEAGMDDILTINQIKTCYAPDWVPIGKPQTDEFQRAHVGKVFFHSPDREAVDQRAIDLRPEHFAFSYLGEWTENMTFLL